MLSDKKMFSCLSTYIGTNQLNILPLSALRERERCKDLQNSEMEILCKYPPLWSQTRKLTGLTQIYLISYQVNGSQRVCSASSAWDKGIVLSRSPIWMSNWPRGEWEQFLVANSNSSNSCRSSVTQSLTHWDFVTSFSFCTFSGWI